MKIIHLCLCGSYNDNWGYQDNMITKYNKKDGHDVTIITSVFIDSTTKVGYEKVGSGTYFDDNGIKIIRLPFSYFPIKKIVEKLRIYKDLYSIITLEKPDLIFMHGIQFVDILTVIKYKKNNPKCRLIADNHASFENSAQNIFSKHILHKMIYKMPIKKSLDYIERIYSITPSCKKFAVEMYGIDEKKIDLLYLGFDTDKVNFSKKEIVRQKIRHNLGISSDDKVIVTGGKLSKGKNIDLLLKALKKIESYKIKLIIFGEFSENIKEDMLELINEDDRVKYVGWTNANDVYELYFASDLAIFPGTQSALWIQAIGSGLPIAIKKWNDLEFLNLGGNCIFMNEDVNDIADVICKTLGDDDQLNKMKEISMTNGYDTFSYERIAREAISIKN